jgi:hypothetical protein
LPLTTDLAQISARLVGDQPGVADDQDILMVK